jgi:hypothetical protein
MSGHWMSELEILGEVKRPMQETCLSEASFSCIAKQALEFPERILMKRIQWLSLLSGFLLDYGGRASKDGQIRGVLAAFTRNKSKRGGPRGHPFIAFHR